MCQRIHKKPAPKRKPWRRLWLLLFCKHRGAYRILNDVMVADQPQAVGDCWMAVCQVCGQVVWIDWEGRVLDRRDGAS